MAILGKNAIGGTGGTYFASDRVCACRFQAGGSGTITSLTARIEARAAGSQWGGLIYADKAGPAPGALLATGTRAALAQAMDWYTDATVALAITSGTWYWIGYHISTGFNYRYDAGAAGQFALVWDPWAPDDPFIEPHSNDYAYDVSVYCDYTPAGVSIPVAMHHYGHHISKIIRG